MFQDYPSKMGIQGCAFLDNQIMKYIDTVQIKERFIEKYTFFFLLHTGNQKLLFYEN